MDAKIFGTFIASCRKERDMTQTDLAVKLNVTDKAVSRWERGIGFPDISTIEPLASALNLSVREIMKSEKEETAEMSVTWGYFKPHVVYLTKEGMADLPEHMKKHVKDGGKLWLVKEPKDGKALISVSKENEDDSVYVNSYNVVEKLRVNKECLPYETEEVRKHLENGGNLYVLMEPINGKALISTNTEMDCNIFMNSRRTFPESIDTSYPEMITAMKECIDTIRKYNVNDIDKSKEAAYTLYNYLVYCTTLEELDDLTSIYRDKSEDNVVGYNPLAVAKFWNEMYKRYVAGEEVTE